MAAKGGKAPKAPAPCGAAFNSRHTNRKQSFPQLVSVLNHAGQWLPVPSTSIAPSATPPTMIRHQPKSAKPCRLT